MVSTDLCSEQLPICLPFPNLYLFPASTSFCSLLFHFILHLLEVSPCKPYDPIKSYRKRMIILCNPHQRACPAAEKGRSASEVAMVGGGASDSAKVQGLGLGEGFGVLGL